MSGEESDRAHSEATRLLSAGVHLDVGFRHRVVDELIGHAERPVAPSLGVDVLSVLAHALRARRQEFHAALGLFATWILFFVVSYATSAPGFGGDIGALLPLPGFAPVGYAIGCFLLLLGRYMGHGGALATYSVEGRRLPAARLRGAEWRRTSGGLMTIFGRLFMLLYWVAALTGIADDVFPVVFPLAMALIVWAYRAQVESVLRDELGRDTFPGRPLFTDLPETPRMRRIADAIAREQHANGMLYDAHHAFVGAGSPVMPWSIALELVPDPDAADTASRPVTGKKQLVPEQGGPVELTSGRIVELIRRPLEELRRATTESSLDRLRDLRIDEFVHLPAGVDRAEGFYSTDVIEAHARAAVDESGEGRRHFLRIQVGAWDEELVVTIFVRTHTQGGMLVLEVVPHVLAPVRDDFRDADALVLTGGRGEVVRNGVRALTHAPAAMFALCFGALRTVTAVTRMLWRGPERRLPDAPVESVREVASASVIPLFHEMDVSRYMKTVQDRIEHGVRDALEQSGYATDRFDQQVVNVLEGGLYIGRMKGGYATGQVSGGVVAMGKQSTASGGAASRPGASDKRKGS